MRGLFVFRPNCQFFWSRDAACDHSSLPFRALRALRSMLARLRLALRRTDDSSQFTISSHRHTVDLAAVMPLAYNIALLIYVRFVGRLAKLPIILRLALCDRWLVFERIPRSFVWMLHCAGARWCCRAMCSLEYRNAVRPLGASMCVSLCLRSE